MTDPSPFLSTIAAVSATMVAIIGGLLVARFVTLDSEQEGAQHVLNDAKARLDQARTRANEARTMLRNWDIRDFFEARVLRKISEGVRDVSELRVEGGYTPLTDDEIKSAADTVHEEFSQARATLPSLIHQAARPPSVLEWDKFRERTPELTEIQWDGVWEIVFMDTLAPPAPYPNSSSAILRGFSIPTSLVTRPAEFTVLDIQRRDALRADKDRAQQQVEDLESEVIRLTQARDAIVRPKGLWGGLLVLTIFTIVGIIVPLWLMSRAPKNLTPGMGEAVFWLFCGGLILLLGYMGWLAIRLSGGRRRNASRR